MAENSLIVDGYGVPDFFVRRCTTGKLLAIPAGFEPATLRVEI